MNLDSIIATLQSVFASFPRIELVILFGSAVKGRLTTSSDLDVAVAAENSLSTEEKIAIVASLSAHYPWDIDLIDLQAVSGPILQQALCNGRVVVKRSPRLLAFLMKKMWFNQADMMPLAKRMLTAHCKQFVRG